MAHRNGWVRCPHCRCELILMVNFYDGYQHECCPNCGRRFILVIEARKIVEVRPEYGM